MDFGALSYKTARRYIYNAHELIWPKAVKAARIPCPTRVRDEAGAA